MSTSDLAYGKRIRWQGQAAEIIDIDWQRLHAVRVRIRIPRAEPRTRWVPVNELEPL
jgi:hypothetical protein